MKLQLLSMLGISLSILAECNAAAASMKAGAMSVGVYISHGVLPGTAAARIAESQIEMMPSQLFDWG